MILAQNTINESDLDKLLRDYRFVPHLSSRTVTKTNALKHFRAQCLGQLSAAGSRHFLITMDGCTGLCWTSPRDYDSKQLGWKTEMIDFIGATGSPDKAFSVEMDLIRNVETSCRKNGVEYLTHRCAADDEASVNTLNSSGFLMLDELATFEIETSRFIPAMPAPGITTRTFRDDDLAKLKDIAGESFVYDRFHAEPMLPRRLADDYHSTWIENLCRGLADHVIVAENATGPAGFITCRIDTAARTTLGISTGTIVLVAAASTARRSGIGRSLVDSAVKWFANRDIDLLEVGTQTGNKPALNMYTSAGFSLRDKRMFFRKWLGDAK